MHPVPHYRLWIYIINGLLIMLQIIYVIWSYVIISDTKMGLFPLRLTDLSIVTMYSSIALQFIACFCGILGVLLSNRNIVRIYWFIMIPIIMFDLIEAVFWSVKFSLIHKEYDSYMVAVIHRQLSDIEFTCGLWKNISADLNCCPPKILLRKCASACWLQPNELGCALPLLSWLHSKTDLLATLLYFLLYPLKLTVVIVLREDIMELFTEIVYNDNRQLYKHWANFDSDEEEETVTVSDSRKSSSHDHDSEMTLIQDKRKTSIRTHSIA